MRPPRAPLVPPDTPQLYAQDDKARPIARFLRSHRVLDREAAPPTRQAVPARLLLDERGEAMRDTVVVSFLFLEKSRRTRENSTVIPLFIGHQ